MEKRTLSPTVQILAVALTVSLVINCFAAYDSYRLSQQQVPAKKRTIYSIQDFYEVATEIDQKLTSNGFTLKEGSWMYLERIQKEFNTTAIQTIEVNMTNWNEGTLLFILSIKNFNVICIHKLFVWNSGQIIFLWLAEINKGTSATWSAENNRWEYSVGVQFYILALKGEIGAPVR